MSKLTDISYIKDVMNRNAMNFSKSLGQNFLINPSVCPKMAENCDCENGVIEIGTGIGVLSIELCKISKKVVAIEIDKKLLPILKETLADFDNFKVYNDDILKIDLKKLIDDEFAGEKVSVCANLPYYITSPVIMMLLESKLPIKSITVMVQKEAATRLCALPGTKECGAISAAVRYYCEPEILFQVGKNSFLPAPKVDSSVIKLNVLDKPNVDILDEKTFFKLIKSSFAQRRKTMLNSVSSGMGISKEDLKLAFEKSNILPNIRGEALSLEQFALLSNAIYERIKAK